MLCQIIWLLLFVCDFGSGSGRQTNCSSNTQGHTANKCKVHYDQRQQKVAPLFKIGGKTFVKRQSPLRIDVSSKNSSEECQLNLNIECIFEKYLHEQSVSVKQVTISCIRPANVSFCRPENSTANDVILYLMFVNHCRVSGADLAVWGRATDLRVLYLFDNVTVQDNGENKADLKGLFNIGSLVLSGLKNKAVPRMFLTHVWKKLAELQLSKLPLQSNLNMLKTTMPSLQSLEISQNNLSALPNFPWYNSSLELPRNLTRTPIMNQHYSEGASINPRLYRRFFVVQLNPLIPDLKFPAGSLDKISLRGNNLESIGSTIFDAVTNLKVIDLSMNKLSQIPERVFEKSQGLVYINLAKNNLTFLNTTTFKNLKSLRKLDLGSNSIHTLQSGLFTDKLQHLEEINFENNAIRIIEAGAFPRGVFHALKRINLRQNKLREVPQFGFYVRNLETYDLSENEVNFTGFVKTIDSLYLPDFLYVHTSSGSSIESTYGIKIDFQKRKTLNLQQNRIKRFDLTNFNKTRLLAFEFILRAFTIVLTGNPLHCDCKTLELQRNLMNLSKTAKEVTEKDFESWVCHSPKELKGMKILSVRPDELRCEIQCQKCPAKCSCYRSDPDSLTFVDCRKRNLTTQPEDLPSGKVELHLEHNKIENLTLSKKMENVSLLYASNNKIKRINLKHFPTKLKEIHLNSNKLKTLPRDFQNLNLSRINLQNNYFACDCKNNWMKSWLKRDWKAFVGGADSVVCSSAGDNQGKPLVSIKDTDFICLKLTETNKQNDNESTSVHTISAYVLAGFLLVVIISIAFLYSFRKELKLILYTRFNWHPFDHVDDSDPSKIYDAFVSFNKRDVVWVMETLRDKLENHNPPYKLCIHCRDFIPGAPIAENILDSVKTSRRMIMVLSRNFIQSEWCMLEFRAAHRRVLKGRANYLIIVLFDDVDVDNLDDELKLYLKTNTYLSVQSKWFWQQLKYALPQKKLETSASAPVVNEALEPDYPRPQGPAPLEPDRINIEARA